jgi:hypothetical protein
MTRLNRTFEPSAESSIARVRELSEHWHTARRVLKCVPVKKDSERKSHVWQPWKESAFASWNRS